MDTDVVIVGAGPTGLLLAGDLARAGVSVTVLDRHGGESPLTRAFAVHARTLEVLDARGLADRLVATGQRISRLRLLGRVELDLSALSTRSTRFPYVLVTPQYHVGRLLEERAVSLGVRVVRGARVSAVTQSDSSARVEYAADDVEHVAEAAWVVGADGHHSTVRQSVGIDFPGGSVVRSLVLADVRLTDPPADVLTVNGTSKGFCFVVPFGDGWYRVITRDAAVDLPDDAPVDLDEVRRTARAVMGTDYGMHDARWMSRFHSEERQATDYRRGRVLLAGDAAHVHSPAGGMGMNTGLQDAANLAWKLAATVQGWAPDGLLDSYQAERHPVGRLVLRASGGLIRGAATGSPVARRARQLALHALLRVPPVRTRALGVVSGLGIHYAPAPGAGDSAGQRAEGLVGPVASADGRTLPVALREGRFVVVAPSASRSWLMPLLDAARAELLVVDVPQWLLVRPDGYVADSGSTPEALDRALGAWGLAPASAPTPPR